MQRTAHTKSARPPEKMGHGQPAAIRGWQIRFPTNPDGTLGTIKRYSAKKRRQWEHKDNV